MSASYDVEGFMRMLIKPFGRFARAVVAGLGLGCVAVSAALYQNDFQSVEVGAVPEDMLVLDGAFAVREAGGNRFLELPGAPLETFGVLFGPAVTNNVAVSARIYGTRRGRLYPAFGVGLGGVNGYKLRVSPGKRELELHRGDTDLRSVPFAWASGKWTHFRLQVREVGAGVCRVEGKAWSEDVREPDTWTISLEAQAPARPGRAAIWGAPYAGTPIRYDDLRLEPVDAAKPD